MRGLGTSLTLAVVLSCGAAEAVFWTDATGALLLSPAGGDGWSNKVELADVNGDGFVDVLFANGGNYGSPGAPAVNEVHLHPGLEGGGFTLAGVSVFGTGDLARVIKVRDLNDDGVADIVVGTTFQTRSRLLLGLGAGAFVEVSDSHIPQAPRSIGDIAIGDVDADGDLDLVLADWGAGDPQSNAGGVTRLWLNNGFGAFTDVTDARMPAVKVRWSWELELVDVDGDFDLDVLVSCKACEGSYLFVNSGAGVFSEVPDALPKFSNNYDFEAMDLDADGDMDLVTINDGPGLTEHVFRNDEGVFVDVTADWWPAGQNTGDDDNMALVADVDSDGDADVVIGSLSGADRLLLNDGAGGLTLALGAFDGAGTPGTLGIAAADLDGDGRLDIAMAQGELAFDNRLFLGVDVAVDTAPPVVAGTLASQDQPDGPVTLRARVHDWKSPSMPHDWQVVGVTWRVDDDLDQETQLVWYGEHLWRAELAVAGEGTLTYRVCGVDAQGNGGCDEDRAFELLASPEPEPGPEREPEPGPEPIAEPAPERLPEPGPEPQLEPGPELVAEPGADPHAESRAEPGPEPHVEPGPEPLAESEPDLASEAEAAADLTPDTSAAGTDSGAAAVNASGSDGDGCAAAPPAAQLGFVLLLLLWSLRRSGYPARSRGFGRRRHLDR